MTKWIIVIAIAAIVLSVVIGTVRVKRQLREIRRGLGAPEGFTAGSARHAQAAMGRADRDLKHSQRASQPLGQEREEPARAETRGNSQRPLRLPDHTPDSMTR